ncbi:hypothetical protein [Fodinicola feengrottensis]|uniref:hypothetical protein n=1 Tax=Fodinicola feengrottensis TaxID=435914 RepID=UPI0013D6DA7A|nr:hypothetical protein [Fodinicola feengrottensis]
MHLAGHSQPIHFGGRGGQLAGQLGLVDRYHHADSGQCGQRRDRRRGVGRRPEQDRGHCPDGGGEARTGQRRARRQREAGRRGEPQGAAEPAHAGRERQQDRHGGDQYERQLRRPWLAGPCGPYGGHHVRTGALAAVAANAGTHPTSAGRARISWISGYANGSNQKSATTTRTGLVRGGGPAASIRSAWPGSRPYCNGPTSQGPPGQATDCCSFRPQATIWGGQRPFGEMPAGLQGGW